MLIDILILIAGLVVLIASGEALVRSAAGLALKTNIPPLIVGLTVVSIGTSAPELFASVSAALSGAQGIAVGNVIGSNIANIALVLGLTALVYPIPVFRGMLYFDISVMVGVSALLFLLASDGLVGRGDGIVLLLIMLAFIAALILKSKWKKRQKQRDALVSNPVESEVEELKGFGQKSYRYLIVLILIGIVGLYFGSDWFVLGAVGIAKSLEISDYVIGVTVVAFGTSVPELVASVIAALRRQTDLSIGNLIGSNIFNIVLVLGTTATIRPLTIPENVLNSDLWWMLGIALSLFPLVMTGYRITRGEGALLICTYLAYLYFVLV